MNDFNLSRRYGPSASAMNSSRKISRSDLAFQKLKKYEEKYKTNRNFASVPLNSVSVEADSESDIEQFKYVTPKYIGPRGIQQDSSTNFEASKHSPQKAEDLAAVESFKNGNITSFDGQPRIAAKNKSLLIDLKVDNVHLVNSDDSKTDYYTSSVPNARQDKNYISRKKSSDVSKLVSEQNLVHKTMRSSLKTSLNNNSIESDTFNDLNNLYRHIVPYDHHTDPDDNYIYSNSISADKEISSRTNNRNESIEADLCLTGEMKEIQRPPQSVEYCTEENKTESLKQIHCDLLSNREKLHVEPESIRTEIFQSNSDVTSYEVPDISNSFDVGIRDKSESPHLDMVVTSELSVASGGDAPWNTDDKTVTVPASNNITDSQLNSAVSLCTKCKKCFKKPYETYCYCNTKSTQTNVNVLHDKKNIQLPNTIPEEDVMLSPYSLFVYNYLLHGYSKDLIKDTDPAVSFLNKSLMEQVNITQYLINSHHATYNAYCTAVRNLSENYQPVTLENTMQIVAVCPSWSDGQCRPRYWPADGGTLGEYRSFAVQPRDGESQPLVHTKWQPVPMPHFNMERNSKIYVKIHKN